ncbi:hypothetical protein [Streptomyces diastaticus]|uniref:hypothetical protein n=1 Tax=Streptomyces diastaticus TaxID=1956 RepID=UPI00381DAAB9
MTAGPVRTSASRTASGDGAAGDGTDGDAEPAGEGKGGAGAGLTVVHPVSRAAASVADTATEADLMS